MILGKAFPFTKMSGFQQTRELGGGRKALQFFQRLHECRPRNGQAMLSGDIVLTLLSSEQCLGFRGTAAEDEMILEFRGMLRNRRDELIGAGNQDRLALQS